MSEWTVDTLKELLEQRFEAERRALDIQSAELARRLDILNHAHMEAVRVQNTYVPREMFEQYREATSKAMSLREGQSKGITSTVGFVITLVVALTGVIGVVALIATR